MTKTYAEARSEVEASLEDAERRNVDFIRENLSVSTLRALLAGPPEPSEEEVRLTIRGVIGAHIIDGRMAELAAQAIQALYRSRRA